MPTLTNRTLAQLTSHSSAAAPRAPKVTGHDDIPSDDISAHSARGGYIQILERKKAALEDRVGQLEKTRRKETAALQAQLHQAQQSRSREIERLNANSQKAQKAQMQDIDDLQQQVKQLKKGRRNEVDELQACVQQLQAAAPPTDEVEQLKEQLQQLETVRLEEVEELQGYMLMQKEKRDRMSEQLVEMTNAESDLVQQMSAKDQEIWDLKKELKEMGELKGHQIVAEDASKLTELKADLVAAQEETERMRAEIKSFVSDGNNKQLEQALEEKASLERLVGQLQQEKKGVKRDLKKVVQNAEVEKAKANEELRVRVESLSSQLKSARAKSKHVFDKLMVMSEKADLLAER